MLMWILRTIGWLMIAQAITRLGIRDQGAQAPPGRPVRGPESRVPAVNPADVIDAEFRPSTSRPGDGGSGAAAT